MTVLVIGAGLAGLAAALELARAGIRVTLAERRPFPGGRTYSFVTEDGDEIDNGQHVFLGCCTAYRTFLSEIGVEHLTRIQWRTSVPFVDGRTGRTSWLCENPLLPAPLHFAPSLFFYRLLTFGERKAVIRCAREMMRADRATLHDVSMNEWLRDHGQSENARRNFWEISVLAVLNERLDRVSAAAALFFFQEGFFNTRESSRVGLATVGLGRIAERAVASIRAAGGNVVFNRKIERLEGHDFYVPAIPARALLELLTPEQRDLDFFRRASSLPTSPIINVHLRFDRPVWRRPFAAFLHSPLQWVFNRSRITGQEGGGTRLTVSLSGAHDLMQETNESISHRIVSELRRLLPDASDAIVKRATVVREPEATFVAAPGTRSMRLPCATPLPNVFLAGEWTESEWPSTMEAAVRSGWRAARAVMQASPVT